ncbi:MAG TPA: hypothetical protein IAA07_05395 [Candidatus Lachnoclostridium stercoravium]|uniref:Molecular chaperone n=1 Tax=Candidatus Lachnoclostridium stercoravium TaxID=2838633 RepID=A0A9D2KNB0_9FIRM|nr:hypothetical protein [Candidatus Lachnoclostridium stercoravium]
MARYTYTLNPDKIQKNEKQTYRRSQLEKMTTFQLKEICRKEQVVIPTAQRWDREGLIRLIMRFRGQKDYHHLTAADEEGLARIQEFLNRCPMKISTDDDIRLPGTIVLYRGTGIDVMDGYEVESSRKLYEGNLLLTDEKNQVYTCFYMKEQNKKMYLLRGQEMPILPLDKNRYFILYFPDERISEYLWERCQGNLGTEPGYAQAVRIPLLNLEVRDVEKTDMPLVIDFGSSNTTMGICTIDNHQKIARTEGGSVIPSVIGIRKVEDTVIHYAFGYEALKMCRQNYRDEDVPVFFDIKRWVSDPERSESVILDDGHKYSIKRKEMLKAFLEYLLDMGKQQFKCSFQNIQMLAPVRQKEKFHDLFTQLLPDYQVDCQLDEGMAVLFQSISQMITQSNYQRGKWYRALIIDCGGGTTDLTSGRFRIENNRVSYMVDLETSYENGDTNFGGNNLTYRIFQLLKIKLIHALGYEKGEISFAGTALEEGFERAERLIPTRFKEYEGRRREEYFSVKNNFYYLFNLSEQIKKQFFQKKSLYELRLGTCQSEEKKGIFLDKWKLSMMEDGKLSHIEQELEIWFYLNEIEDVLRPDIYGLIERFLDQKFNSGELQKYGMIKLTGQSCKSRLFTEALKQFVPGKLIQNTRSEEDGEKLKMCCLEGALSYFSNCKLGYMKVNRRYEVSALPYEIMAYTHENQEHILIRSLDKENHIGWISRFKIGRQLDLYLNSAQGRRLKTYCFEYDASQFTRTYQEEIDRQYPGTIIQEETDTILEGEMKFFIWVSRKRWGFIVLPILREGDLLYKGEETFFDFEDDTWELNFFDGRK